MGRLTTYDKKGEAWVDFLQIPNALNKLAHYEDMEEAGRLIGLPCAVGDKVWLIVETENGYQIEGDMVEGIHINQYASYSLSYRLRDCIDTTQLPSIPLKAFGEVIFTTKEEAEVKLKELEGVKE